MQGWTYAFQACKSNFLDCYFLDHSSCPKIRTNVKEDETVRVNESRFKMAPLVNMEMRPEWWVPLVGTPSKYIPERSIRDLGMDSIPSRMAFYSYFFRPNYRVRHEIAQRVQRFDWGNMNMRGKVEEGKGEREGGDVCAAMHVRRGDVIFHQGAARFYLALKHYVQGALPYIKSLGVTTILLLTDSQAVIDEAVACEKDFPEICGGISWRFVQKKRWRGAEGGWEVSK